TYTFVLTQSLHRPVPIPFRFIAMIIFKHDFHRRYLHSFPTRRSSDLCACSIERCRRSRPIRARCGRGSTRSSGCGRRSPPRRREDRKSTRLNSSHVAISYAVFCLLKKDNLILPILLIILLLVTLIVLF